MRPLFLLTFACLFGCAPAKPSPRDPLDVNNWGRPHWHEYVERLRDRIRQVWGPAAQKRENAEFGLEKCGQFGQERTTRVIFRLRRDGSLESAKVTESSGMDWLDEVGLQAMRDAAPFGPTPDGLAEPEPGLVTLNFAFTLERDRRCPAH